MTGGWLASHVVVVVVALLVAIPAVGAATYFAGTSAAPHQSAPKALVNETLSLNGSRPAPASNATVITVPTSDLINTFAVAFQSPVVADFCLNFDVSSGFEPNDYGLCLMYGPPSLVANVTHGSISIGNIFTTDLFGAYVPSGGAAVISFTWWANATNGPVSAGAGSLFVSSGAASTSQDDLEVPISGTPTSVSVYINSSAPVNVIPTGSLCCARSLEPASAHWALTVGYLGGGAAIVEIAWSEDTSVMVAVNVVAYY